MSNRLYLLRHAKSSWDNPELADHDRPLAKRGRRAAEALARHLREREITPELVLCSSARRTRETFERIEAALGAPAVRYERELYGASATALIGRLREVPDGLGSVMLIGHNPGIEDVTVALAGRAPAAKFPTAALATLAFPGPSWTELDRGGARLVDFVRPRDLKA